MAKILIADDDDLLIDLLAMHLGSAGHSVMVASDGRIALEKVDLDRPDAAILDAMMPVLGGLDVLRRLRSRPDTTTLPVMMLTARKSEGDIAAFLEAGANEYLAKPFSSQELIMRLEMMLRKAARIQ